MSDIYKRADSLITYYQTQYKKKFSKIENLNRNKLQYSVANILKDLTVTDAKRLIDFYIATDKAPSLQKFCFEYDEVGTQMNLQKEDENLRNNLMSDTKKRVEEYRKRYGA